MALAPRQIPAVTWENYAGNNKDLIAPVLCDFSLHSEYVISPFGGLGGASSLINAEGLVIDNQRNSGFITVAIGGMLEDVPPYSKSLITLSGQTPAVRVTADTPNMAALLTFFTGVFRGTTYGNNYLDAQRKALADVAVGFVQMFAGPAVTVPAGWLFCDGAAVSRETYAALFDVIGTSWGVGDGATTFNLPNMNRRSPMGAGSGIALGAYFGAEAHQLTYDEMPAHAHSLSQGVHNHGNTTVEGQVHAHTLNAAYKSTTLSTGGPHAVILTDGSTGSSGIGTVGATGTQSANHLHATLDSTIPISVMNSGNNHAHNNIHPCAGMNFIIKF